MQPSSPFVDRDFGAAKLDARTSIEVKDDSDATWQAVAVQESADGGCSGSAIAMHQPFINAR